MTAAATMPNPRWWRFGKKRRLVCPLNHRIPHSAEFPEHGFIRCPKHGCDRWIFVFVVRPFGCIITEVTLDEMDEMQELDTPEAMLEYLAIWPTV
jgi:hypothetical protein